MEMNKKGDLTAGQIIMLVIAIIGFSIVLIALFLLNLGDYSEKDMCKLSVLTRATTPGKAQAAIPLKCKVEKICLTEKYFGGCKEQFAGEENVKYVRLTGSITNKRRIIEETSANAMYDCWSKMGEGKLDLFGSAPADFGLGPVESSCVVCSRVAIDKGVDSKTLFITDDKGSFVLDSNSRWISAINIREYMKTHQIPGQSLTYLQAFTDKAVSSYAVVDESKTKDEKTLITATQVNNEMAFVFMQIKSKDVGDVLKNQLYAGGAIAGAVLLSPAGKVISFVGAKFVLIGVAATAVGVGAMGVVNALEGQKVAGAYCGQFTSEERADRGCSIVQGMSYRFDTLNKLCGSFEGEF